MRNDKDTSFQNAAGKELYSFLLNLPVVSTTKGVYRKEELQIRLPEEMSERLRMLSEAVNLLSARQSDSDGAPASKSNRVRFRPDQLITYLVSEFLASHESGVNSLVDNFSALSHQALIDEVEARNRLLAKFSKVG